MIILSPTIVFAALILLVSGDNSVSKFVRTDFGLRMPIKKRIIQEGMRAGF